jgi:hypothetical protein
MAKIRDRSINIVGTLEEKLAIQNAKADLQLYEGRAFTYGQVLMYLFFIYNSEHKLLDDVRKQVIADSNGELAHITNDQLIQFLFGIYLEKRQSLLDQPSADSPPSSDSQTPLG